MFNRVLVPHDGSETSIKALVAGLQMARASGGCVRIVHCLDEFAFRSADLRRFEHEQAAKLLEDAMEAAKFSGVPADSRLADAPGQRLGEVVATEARAWGADLIVVGTHGRRGVSRLLLGSGAEQIVRLAPVPVLTIPGEAHRNAHQDLAARDDHDQSRPWHGSSPDGVPIEHSASS